MAIKQPLISVIITCYNDGEYLQLCIGSVEKIKDIIFELIIINDGSTELKTRKLLDELKAAGFRVIDQPNQGPAVARNTGINAAVSDYIITIDADNFIEPEYVYEGIKILDAEPRTGVVYADCYVFGAEQGKRMLPDFDFVKLLGGNFIDTCAVFRKKVWTETGGMETDPALKAHHDWEFWIRVAKKGWHFHHISRCLYHYRIKQNSISSYAAQPENKKQIISFITAKHGDVYKQYSTEITTAHHLHINHLDTIISQQKTTINSLEHYGKNLMEMANALETRLRSIESSRWWKIRIQIAKFRALFNAKDNTSSKRWKFVGKVAFFLTSKGRKIIRQLLTRIFKYLYLMFEDRSVVIIVDDVATGKSGQDAYQTWIQKYQPTENEYDMMPGIIAGFQLQPLFSIIVPVYNPPPGFFKQMIESVIDQTYTNWELCLADDASTDAEVRNIISSYVDTDERIKVIYRESNGHIAAASNSALEIATGEFIVMLDQDDLLSKDALFEVARLLNLYPHADLIYSDEDKIDEDNHRQNPHFKPIWSPDNLLSRNYISHLSVLRHTIIKQIGGFRLDFNGSQDYDLLLRFTEQTKNIFRIPKVLYHWRIHSKSIAGSEGAKPYAHLAAQKALTEALIRRGEPGTVDFLPGFKGFCIRYQILEYKKVSVIIPTKNQAKILNTCLKSIFEKTTYPDFEVILVDNNSDEQSLFDLVTKFEKQEPERFKCLKLNVPFNFSVLMNEAVKMSKGDYVLLLNNDTEVITTDWMDAMVEQAQRPSIGAVGAKLLFPNNTIQHGGVIIGTGGLPAHAFVGNNKDGPGYFNYVNTINNYIAVTAACLMCRKETYIKVGGFDESYAVEYNDVDFCMRLIEAGYYNIYLPHVILYHYESLTRGHPKSSKDSYARHLIELKNYQTKWKKYIELDPYLSPNLKLSHYDFEINLHR